MSPQQTKSQIKGSAAASSSEIASAIKAADYSGCAVTMVGYGFMGQHYVRSLQALGAGPITVCSRSQGPLGEIAGDDGITTLSGGYTMLDAPPRGDELCIVAVPTPGLIPAAEHMVKLGFRKLLIEKPVSFWSGQIKDLSETLNQTGVDAVCAYNRVAYPSFLEARHLAAQDGGITSGTYCFTEFTDRIGPEQFSAQELARWGIANSLHVLSMAHGLIGAPQDWDCRRTGAISWHPSGAVFVGNGHSQDGIPFSFHADWGSKSRWTVEFHTSQRSYRLCPLEQLFAKASATGDWEEIPVAAFDSNLKAGIAEQVAAALKPEIRELLPLISLGQAAVLTSFGEDLFGYEAAPPNG